MTNEQRVVVTYDDEEVGQHERETFTVEADDWDDARFEALSQAAAKWARRSIAGIDVGVFRATREGTTDD